ncbi:MAG: ABC transporter ATP-binding protein [Thermodesulfovibrio sp.]|jgi:branched-chain amino acid transport system ATP-binding protein|uniref:ABC transporter ATP-binding protein n=2 Tax=Thermodesulfovibrio TaxID=28261 RepID=A0A2J6WPI7_9BACT|nr:MAG: ABC transporter ATP-binding protein [Thermodesulfovibrio aggregans]
MIILETKNLAKKYGGLEVLNNVNLKVYKGEILGLIGPNGAGKTTLMNLICRLTDITRGEIYYKGELINNKKSYEISKMGIARTFQVVKPFKGLTVLENVMVGAFYGRKNAKTNAEAKDIAMEALKIVGLLNEKDKEPSILPIAQRKKLELARALAMDPELLILDEVMAGLNPKELDDIMKEILLLKERGITIIAIEHVMKVIMGISDRVVVLHLGELICDGKPHEVCNHPQVIEAYLGSKFAQKGVA